MIKEKGILTLFVKFKPLPYFITKKGNTIFKRKLTLAFLLPKTPYIN